MVTVHREDGFQVRIYPADQIPPHVHIYKAGGVVKVEIGTGRIMGVVRPFKQQDIVKAVRIVLARTEQLTAEWRKIHG